MSTGIDAWAATPGGRKVLAEARRRIEGGSQLLRGSLTVELNAAERRDVGGLLGITWEASGAAPPIAALHKALEARGTTLHELLERDAPLRDLRGERRAARADADAERSRAVDILGEVDIDAGIATWALSRRGLPKAGTGKLVDIARDVALVWQKKPGPDAPAVQLPVLAGDLFNNTHALDRNTDLGRTVARIAAADANIGADLTGGDRAAIDITTVTQWRAAWTHIGVICDTVSSLVLTLNLRLTGSAAAVPLTAVAGEPVWLTLRSLDGDWTADARDVWVCENPAVVEAAADRLGEACPALVCTYGQPSLAAMTLLRGMGAAGCTVHLRADDDSAGQTIVAQVLAAVHDAQLWRYARRPAADAAASPKYEEQLLNDLISDLAEPA